MSTPRKWTSGDGWGIFACWLLLLYPVWMMCGYPPHLMAGYVIAFTTIAPAVLVWLFLRDGLSRLFGRG